jgi:hypothetical protein
LVSTLVNGDAGDASAAIGWSPLAPASNIKETGRTMFNMRPA